MLWQFFLIMEEKRKSYTFEEIKQKMINYCVYQDRCHQEVEQKMRDFLLIPEAKEEILLYLIQENYLNEERFARSFIRGKFYLKHWGKIKIKNQLKLKGVSEKLIDKSMNEIDDEDYENTIKKLFERYYSGLKSIPEYQKNIKSIRYIISRGFEYELVKDIVLE